MVCAGVVMFSFSSRSIRAESVRSIPSNDKERSTVYNCLSAFLPTEVDILSEIITTLFLVVIFTVYQFLFEVFVVAIYILRI